MSIRTIESRFAITVASNLFRGGISFLTGVLLARGLGPEQYGNLAFLLGSFASFKLLLEVGTTNAFYTFMSQKPRGPVFVAWYAAWQAIQFFLPFLMIAVLMPRAWVDLIWVGQDRGVVLIAFAAAFLQQQAWLTVSQIGESRRLTHRVQSLNVAIAVVHLFLILLLWRLDYLAVPVVFGVICAEYLLATAVALSILEVKAASDETVSLGAMVRDYARYCKPLLFYSWLSFAYSFADSWLLQKFGGAREQAYFGVANQFATVSLVATTAMLQIFWKEIAEAHELKNLDRVSDLYRRISRLLFMVGAGISGFLVPWSADIVRIILGPEYVGGAIVLGVMLIYPVHQSLGQIRGTLFYATGNTRPQVVIGIAFMAMSIPITYFVQAPGDAHIPGFELGATGMAIKMVALQIVAVNIMGWAIARNFGWKFEWTYQVIGMAGALLLGWVTYEAVNTALGAAGVPPLLQICIAGVLYLVAAAAIVWTMPSVIGVGTHEMREYVLRVRSARGHGG